MAIKEQTIYKNSEIITGFTPTKGYSFHVATPVRTVFNFLTVQQAKQYVDSLPENQEVQ